MKPITIAVCTRGRGDLPITVLRDMIYTIKSNNLISFFDVLVIDNNDLPSVILDCSESFLKLVHCDKQGLSNARNFALLNSISEYVWFVDDECILPDRSLNKMLNNVKLDIYDFIGGPVSFLVDQPLNNFNYDFNKIIRDYSFNRPVQSICGSNYCVKRSVALTLGGFKPELGMSGNQIRLGEESDLIKRYNFANPKWESRKFYDPELVTYSIFLEQKGFKFNQYRRAYASGKYARFKSDQDKYLQKYMPINFSDISTYDLHRDNLLPKITVAARILIYLTQLGYFSKFLKILSYIWKLLKISGILNLIFFMIGYSKKH
jgi:glycosyltransferase involved in cell wall biosynthesis